MIGSRTLYQLPVARKEQHKEHKNASIRRKASFESTMTTITQTEAPEFTKIELRTAYGPVFRDVLKSEPRPARDDEVPTIDISGIYGDFEARKALAKTIREAAENTGFFYIKNHGISSEIVEGALNSAKTFFKQPSEKKQSVSKSFSKYFNGWTANGTSHACKSEGGLLPLVRPARPTTDHSQSIIVKGSPGDMNLNMTPSQRIPPPSLQRSTSKGKASCGTAPVIYPALKKAASTTGKNA